MLARFGRSDFSSIAKTFCEVFGLFRGASTQSFPPSFQSQDPKDADYVLDYSGKQGISPLTSDPSLEDFVRQISDDGWPGRAL
jgi:hypothetical protein